MNDDTEHGRNLALTFLQACFELNIDSAASMMSDDFSWWVLGDASVLRVSGTRDRAGAIRMLTGVRRILPNGMRHDVIGVVADVGKVAVEVNAAGLLATGQDYRNSYHFVIALKGGQIGGVREYLDTFAVSHLTGAMRSSLLEPATRS